MEKVTERRKEWILDDRPKTSEELREAMERWLAEIEEDIEREKEKEACKNAEKY